MKKLLLILVLLGCDDTPAQKKAQEDWWQERQLKNLTHGTRYYKDLATNLCFVGMDIGAYYGLLTNVPCTQEVEDRAYHFSSQPK
jgi:hypothetical protein